MIGTAAKETIFKMIKTPKTQLQLSLRSLTKIVSYV